LVAVKEELSRASTLLVLDNFETISQNDPMRVKRWVCDLADIPAVSLVITTRRDDFFDVLASDHGIQVPISIPGLDE
jgi:hypothetical protein